MDEQNLENLENLDEATKQAVIASLQNYLSAIEIKNLINSKFSVKNLCVAVTTDKTVSITGIVDNRIVKFDIEKFLLNSGKANQLINDLISEKPF